MRAEKRFEAVLQVMIFMVVIVGAILFAYCETGGWEEMKKGILVGFWLFIGGIALIIASAVVLIFSAEEKKSVSAYVIEPPEKDGKQTLKVLKSFPADKAIDNVARVEIDGTYVIEPPQGAGKNTLEVSTAGDSILLDDTIIDDIGRVEIDGAFVDLPEKFLRTLAAKQKPITVNAENWFTALLKKFRRKKNKDKEIKITVSAENSGSGD